MTAIPDATDGASGPRLFSSGGLTVGGGEAPGVSDSGAPGTGSQRCATGQVLPVPDGALFGRGLREGDNTRRLAMLAP